ncbi:MAG: hypothetical protein C0626_00445 [Arcobacter sp.]|uniref:protoheme IX farnesyltransferase n=1 Tax=uncultured Arcobacter sp. TaxID=165434 RepID=UPI000CB836C5|nr:UbiA family prenyltransferase [uncultured Arcobacter sp.]PLY11076.1 MAG: hypothetical protein C0626_00445 [Arcobacter sp.]
MSINLKDFLVLTKFKLSFAVTLSSVFSFILVREEISFDIIYPLIGVLLLALGVSALNQYQEYLDDAKMARTKNRPIASGKISPREGLIISLGLILLSYITIFFSLNYVGIIIFTSVIILYNFVYTKTKKTTVYAAVYGAILGVIPPLIGWLAGGGEITDIRFLAIGLFYLVWQIPHFWLLILKYHKQYESAGFNTVANTFGVQRLERITFVWLLLTIICGLFTVALFPIKSNIIFLLIFLLVLYTLYSVFQLRKQHNYLKVFIAINIYITLLMILLSINILL